MVFIFADNPKREHRKRKPQNESYGKRFLVQIVKSSNQIEVAIGQSRIGGGGSGSNGAQYGAGLCT
jgi:hypothetical protein